MPDLEDDVVPTDAEEVVVDADNQEDMPELIDGISDADDIGEGDSVITEAVDTGSEADLTSINALFTDLNGLADALVAFKKDPSALMKQTLKHKLTGVTLAKRRVDIDIKEQTA